MRFSGYAKPLMRASITVQNRNSEIALGEFLMSSRIVNFPSSEQVKSTIEPADGGNAKLIAAALITGGCALAIFGLSRKSLPGAALGAAGGYLIYGGAF